MNAPGPQLASPGRRLAGFALDWVLSFLTVSIGWIIWWLIVARSGRSPAKQLLGMRIIREDGAPAGLGRMVLRFVVVINLAPILLMGVLVYLLDDYVVVAGYYLGFAVAALWCVWDANRQCLWDKVVNTRVVHDRALERTEVSPWT